MPDDSQLDSISDVLEALVDRTDGREVSVNDVTDAFGDRSHGPLLMIPSALTLIPFIGAIPVVPTVMGGVVFLIAVQMLLARRRPWIPSQLGNRRVERDKLTRGVDKALPWARRVERLLEPRLTFLLSRPFRLLVAVLCLGLAPAMSLLEVVPWAASAPAAAIFLFGVGMTTRDGAAMVLGWLATAGSAGLLWWSWSSITG